MPRWLFLTLLSFGVFGIWGVVSAVVSREASPLTVQVLSTAGIVPVCLLLIFTPNWRAGSRPGRGIMWAALCGTCANAGNLCLLRALNLDGPVSIVLPVSSMYPLITAGLAIVFLRERLNRIQIFGFCLALVAIYLAALASSDAPATGESRTLRLSALTQPWMLWTFASLILFGVTGYFQKLATFHIADALCTVVFGLVAIPIAAAIVILQPGTPLAVSPRVWGLALAFGVLLGVGTLVLFAAYRSGKASVVTALLAMYPALSVLLAVPLLHEQLDTLRVLAMSFALSAGLALGCEKRPPPAKTAPGDGRVEGPGNGAEAGVPLAEFKPDRKK